MLEIIITILSVIAYFLIGIGSAKLRIASGLSQELSILSVLVWPIELIFYSAYL